MNSTDTSQFLEQPSYWTRVIERRTRQGIRETMHEQGLRRGTYRLLSRLAEGPVALDQLTDEGMHGFGPRPPVGAIILRLAERGWLAIDNGEVRLTDEGAQVQAGAAAAVAKVRESVYDGISDEDHATTLTTLRRMAENVGWDESEPDRSHRGHGRGGHDRGHRFGPRDFGPDEHERGFGPRGFHGGFHPGFGGGFLPFAPGGFGASGGEFGRGGFGPFGPFPPEFGPFGFGGRGRGRGRGFGRGFGWAPEGDDHAGSEREHGRRHHGPDDQHGHEHERDQHGHQHGGHGRGHGRFDTEAPTDQAPSDPTPRNED